MKRPGESSRANRRSFKASAQTKSRGRKISFYRNDPLILYLVFHSTMRTIIRKSAQPHTCVFFFATTLFHEFLLILQLLLFEVYIYTRSPQPLICLLIAFLRLKISPAVYIIFTVKARNFSRCLLFVDLSSLYIQRSCCALLFYTPRFF